MDGTHLTIILNKNLQFVQIRNDYPAINSKMTSVKTENLMNFMLTHRGRRNNDNFYSVENTKAYPLFSLLSSSRNILICIERSFEVNHIAHLDF